MNSQEFMLRRVWYFLQGYFVDDRNNLPNFNCPVTKKTLNCSGPEPKVILLSNQIAAGAVFDGAAPRNLSTHRSARVLNLRRDPDRGENASVIISYVLPTPDLPGNYNREKKGAPRCSLD